MFDRVQSELNELLAIVQETALVRAGLALDPAAKRSDAAMREFERKEGRKVELMEKYNLVDNVVYAQRSAMPSA